MKRLKLYYINENYIDYLRRFDSKVPYNKSTTRPYVGVVLQYRGFNYFAPLSSPRPKHLKINEYAVDIFKIDEGKLGVVNINNMLPVPSECLVELLPTITDKKYKILLENQLTFLNDNKRNLYTKVSVFYLRYKKGHLSDSVLERTCNLDLLEKKCLQYNSKISV